MKTILKVILALSLVSSALFGADKYSEQKEKIVAKILEHFGDNLIIPSKCESEGGCDENSYYVSFEKFPNELKKYFTDSFLNTFKNNQNVVVFQDYVEFRFPKQVEDYAFKCQKSGCKIEDIYTNSCYNSDKNGKCKVTKSLFDYKNNMKIDSQIRKKFYGKLDEYSKKFKASQEFFNTFEEVKKPLGEYFSSDLKKCKNADEYDSYDRATLNEENSLIELDAGFTTYHLIFDCNAGKCEIIDIGVWEQSDVAGYPSYGYWLKEKCNKK